MMKQEEVEQEEFEIPDDEEEQQAGEKSIKKQFHVQQRIYDMILYGYPALEQMPKSQKFSLAQDIKHCMDKIMRLCIAANKKYTKKTTLQELDVEVAALKVYLRIAFDLKYLPPKKYEVWSGLVVEVGKMIGGWIRSQREAAQPKKETDEKYLCSDCGEEIPQKAQKYSNEHFGRALCYKCQKKESPKRQGK
ncbi:hypothetical protein SDC9_75684 [bioreactor metagenome]|uniref:bAvd-like domain-containing protein n=1 Tax=bioreactor metagenome TaxID=1076179 RepID=A0A644YSV1_9ZZZZ